MLYEGYRGNPSECRREQKGRNRCVCLQIAKSVKSSIKAPKIIKWLVNIASYIMFRKAL